MRLYQHSIISGAFSTLFYFYTKNISASLALFFFGTLIDIDHLLDYFIKIKWRLKQFRLKEFFRSYRLEPQPKYYLILHSFEFSLIIPLVIYLSGCKILALAVFIGYFPHILLDTLFNHGHPFGYFIIYRWIKKFKIY